MKSKAYSDPHFLIEAEHDPEVPQGEYQGTRRTHGSGSRVSLKWIDLKRTEADQRSNVIIMQVGTLLWRGTS
jgi:hypothetical protein